jgi:hypothetical protein
MPDEQTNLRKLAEFARTQPSTSELGYDDFAQATTRAELGISSLSVIMLIVEYINANAPGVAVRPEWVARLETVAGIASVIGEIEADRLQRASA